MEVKLIQENKSKFMDLLLLADEQESMIQKYIGRGDLFALYDPDLKGICVVTKEDEITCEIKNIAIYPKYQRRGYGRKLIHHVLNYYKNVFQTILVGTGESRLTIPFYESCGFVFSHRVKDFFIINYDHPMFEEGVQLKDMIYLKRYI